MNKPRITPLRVIRGDTTHLDVHVFDANSNPWKLSVGEKIIFGVKETPDSAEYLIKKTVNSGESPFRITLKPEDTALIAVGGYHYDIGLQSGTDYFYAIPMSPFTVCSSITGWEE